MATDSGFFVAPTFGAHKESLLTADHNGWYLLDGRAMTALPVSARAQATILALGANLVQMANSTMIDGAAYGTVAGATAVTLAQTNLPNFNIGGTLDQLTNNHNHGVNGGVGVRRQAAGGGWRSGTPTNGRVTPRNITTTNSGAHAHTWAVPSGGGGVAIPMQAEYMSVRFFIFLGL